MIVIVGTNYTYMDFMGCLTCDELVS